VPSLIIQSYKEYESVHMINGIKVGREDKRIALSVACMTDPISKPATMLYSSEAKTDRVTRLHFVEL
jgi:hypothetical protein